MSASEEQPVDYESTPITRAEYISAIVHLYRGELARADTWRLRLDTTTNWAVITAAGLLTFTFGQKEHSHWVLLLGLALIAVLHGFEARRFRSWHVWRSRVRMIEENFYGPILRRDPRSPEAAWGSLVASDLFQPSYKIGRLQALRARLVRNYWAIYVALLGAWVVKVAAVLETPEGEPEGFAARLAEGRLPWWAAVAYLGAFLGFVVVLLLTPPPATGSSAESWPTDARDGRVPADL